MGDLWIQVLLPLRWARSAEVAERSSSRTWKSGRRRHRSAAERWLQSGTKGAADDTGTCLPIRLEQEPPGCRASRPAHLPTCQPESASRMSIWARKYTLTVADDHESRRCSR